ncbi:hypothetical protein MMC11_003609 [Xylographa trunciseda]|nr:hypothetical protein [Xylographa trunciseda]
MASYQILVKNKSGAPRAYFLFVETPQVSNVPAAKVFQNVYIAAKPVPDMTGTAIFKVIKDLYAVTGTSPSALDANVSVYTGDYEVVKICQSSGAATTQGSATHVTGGSGAQFDTSKLTETCNTEGSFSIQTDSSFRFPNPDNIFIGLGAADPDDKTTIVPVATFQAMPSTTNFIIPVTKYYVSWGTYTAGQVIDVATISASAPVDFTGKSSSLAKIVHNNDGTFDVTFN